MDRRRMCPNCRAFISSDDRQCQYCGVALQSVAQTKLRASSGGEGFIPEHAFTTFILLLINAAMWAISMILSSQAGNEHALMNIDGETLVLLGAKFTPYIRGAGQWWRLITAGFLHGGLLHIAMNGWAMLSIGRQVDMVYGSARYLIIFFAGTAGGFWMSLMFSPASLSVGASAGLCGLVGSMIAVGFLSKSQVAASLRQGYLQYAGFVVVLGALTSFGGGLRIDNMAHIGGLGAGFAAAMIVGLPMPVIPARERLWTLAAWICVLLTVFSFFQMVMFFTRMHQAPLIPPASPAPKVRELPRQQL